MKERATNQNQHCPIPYSSLFLAPPTYKIKHLQERRKKRSAPNEKRMENTWNLPQPLRHIMNGKQSQEKSQREKKTSSPKSLRHNNAEVMKHNDTP